MASTGTGGSYKFCRRLQLNSGFDSVLSRHLPEGEFPFLGDVQQVHFLYQITARRLHVVFLLVYCDDGVGGSEKNIVVL